MVLFVDLEEDPEPPEGIWSGQGRCFEGGRGGIGERGGPWGVGFERVNEGWIRQDEGGGEGGEVGDVRINPNRNAITEALACYPIVISLASHIDLNTLDALSLTCRQIRVNLLQFRTQLLASTLHCENEDVELDPEHTFRYRARAADWYFVEVGREGGGAGVGKVGDCARDLVGGCRRCGRVVCRNCTIKPPAPNMLRHRHRRICQSCSHAPLSRLTNPSPSSQSPHPSPPSFSSTLFPLLLRSTCTCPTAGVWLCQPCGRSIRSADQEYESIWKWRTRYLPSLGGLGVGIGEGNRGVPCGRGGECVAAREVEQEVDCDAEDKRVESGSRAGTPGSLASSSGSVGSFVAGGVGGNGGGAGGALNGGFTSSAGQVQRETQMGPGYARHEIEGIGGVVKKKLVRMVKVGACVPEWSEEKEQGRFLVREMDGKARSWCGWCWKVVLGGKDGQELGVWRD